jgi:RNA polymerase sigma factor (sigma-70 family)
VSEVAAPAGFNRLLSDDRLTRRAVRGDERAFAAIFRRYHQSLYRFCLAIVGDPEEAQDALQNTMMKVLRALPGEERRIELRPWLYRIAHNESIDLLRRRRETRQLDAEHAAPGYGLAEDAATRERLRRLLSDLRELPERQREVLVMRELAGLEFEEIGAALDTSGAVARQTLYEARLSLRQMEEGREMGCEAVTKALSDGDGRVTRRRDVRAHLRSCADCRHFREKIEGRQQDLAALSPLPAVAAAGMLQGLIGGSGASVGGGLAATLGGGAAKTIAGSAVTKGVATAAVVAAVGVTAADRTGVIHVGLPGDGGAGSSKSAPGSGGASPIAHPDGTSGSVSGGERSQGSDAQQGNRGKAGDAASKAAPGGDSQQAQAQGQGQGHGQAKGHERGHDSPADPEAQSPPLEDATGKDHEKQRPEGATGGQETAADAKPPAREPPDTGEKGSPPEATPKPDREPNPQPPDPPKEPPANPPQGAAPNPPPQLQQPPGPPGKAAESAAPGKSGEHGQGAGKP